ncbi:MAG TPA: trypsin-like peptidase domain-containing protein [Acidimicrobiia bacterium]|nr:trypsin-like peptidase domain-containing protein [Acidimicrobiia bacterium]
MPFESFGHRRRALVATTLLVVAVGAGAACSDRSGASQPAAAVAAPAAGNPTTPAPALQDAYEQVIQRVRPSVVEVATDFGLGSGVVYDDAGHIVTNAHVVGDATNFKVALADGHTHSATLVGVYRPDDLAIIKLNGGPRLTPARFADSSKVEVGAITLAIGNPLGLASSVTDGIVSFNGRTVSEGDGVVLASTIQTSAPINPGNSGGALVDLDGEVIGIPTLAAADAQVGGAAPGIGFAIPANTVKRIADQLIARGQVTNSGRAALGIAGTTAATFLGEPVGVVIRKVDPAGPAANAGLQPGDVITGIDDHPITDLASLQEQLAGLEPGARAKVDVLNPDGSRRSVQVTLGTL